MDYRQLGRTGHNSSVVVLGGAALRQSSLSEAEAMLALALKRGVNHIDVAPAYGDAEALLGQVLGTVRTQFFISCKTRGRDRQSAWSDLNRSLERLRTGYVELYQFHGVTSDNALDEIMSRGGAAEAFDRARSEGLIRHIGITGHYERVPSIFERAIKALDLDTIMLPLNADMLALTQYRVALERLFKLCHERAVGIIAIKVLARRPWPTALRTHQTWYEPLTDPEDVQRAVDLALSMPITSFTSPGDPGLFGPAVDAARRWRRLREDELEDRIRGTTGIALTEAVSPSPPSAVESRGQDRP